jgi:hypothetical protein
MNDTLISEPTTHEITANPITEAEMPYVLPQHLNREVFEKRTAKYDLFESDTIIQNLRRMDFVVRDAITQKNRRGSNGGTQAMTRHLYRLCRTSDFGKQEMPELVLVNSHNGACSLRVYQGFFRLICENGMICGGHEALRIRHMGHTMEEVLDRIRDVAERFGDTYGKIDSMKSRILTNDEIMDFAERSNKIRPSMNLRAIGRASDLVNPIRPEDNGNDLWSVFNRVQEHTMKGGLELAYDGTEKRLRRTRPIRNIAQNIEANRGLWEIAETYL